PYLKKPNFYGSRGAFEAGTPHDGFYLEIAPEQTITLVGRISNCMYRLTQSTNGDGYQYDDGIIAVRVSSGGSFSRAPTAVPLKVTHQIDVGRFYALATLLRGVIDSTRVHAINTPLLAAVGKA